MELLYQNMIKGNILPTNCNTLKFAYPPTTDPELVKKVKKMEKRDQACRKDGVRKEKK